MKTGPFLPGSTIGILGSGQLGRMLALVARQMGYKVQVYSPDAGTPAGAVADKEWTASYTDEIMLRQFAETVDVVTLEFENIPVEALNVINRYVPVHPHPRVLFVTQNRLREKLFLDELGIPVVPFQAVENEQDLEAGLAALGLPLILKTAGFGYDGKGQAKISSPEEARHAYSNLQGQPCILESFIDLELEISVIAARTESEFKAYQPVENRHKNHILDVTIAPASITPELETQAIAITRHIVEVLEVRGVLCAEFFVTKQGQLLVNELAPRPHNSGHWSIEGAITSQFEQQLRAVCGLPLGNTNIIKPAAMFNLLGDIWTAGEPDWRATLQQPDVHLHLYGKQAPRPGRKMGHLTALGDTADQAFSAGQAAKNALTSTHAVTS
jgi:5-(carboxyamino)imidazole ribonucleotide synthase